MFAKASKRFI